MGTSIRCAEMSKSTPSRLLDREHTAKAGGRRAVVLMDDAASSTVSLELYYSLQTGHAGLEYNLERVC